MRGSEAEVGLELNFVNWVLFSSLLRVPGEEPSGGHFGEGGILLLGAGSRGPRAEACQAAYKLRPLCQEKFP